MRENELIEKLEFIFQQSEKIHSNFDEMLILQLQEIMKIPISLEYHIILKKYTDRYVKEDIGIHALEKSPIAYKDGYDDFSYFYGLIGKGNIFEVIDVYKEQLPSGYIPIGNADGGNQICISCNDTDQGYIYLWIHDELECKCLYLMEKSLETFIIKLEMKKNQKREEEIEPKGVWFSNDLLEMMKNHKKDK